MFTYIDFSDIRGGTAVACDRLPAAPAVYAFFRNIKLSVDGSAKDFLQSVVQCLAARAAPDRSSKVGPLHKVTLLCQSDLSETKAVELSTHAQSPGFREFLGKIVGKATLLQSPLYVGKADSLQSRIRQHLDPMSDLATRLREADITLHNCTLAYTIIDESPIRLTESMLFLIEEIITRLCRPGFVSRIG